MTSTGASPATLLACFLVGALATAVVGGAAVVLHAKTGARSFGHYGYGVADPRTLIDVDGDGKVRMRRTAGRAFRAMQQDARRDGVVIVPVSGFRTMEQQGALFFDVAAEKNEALAARALLCAPPGFSEHHTGYALDLGDGEHRESQLEVTFRDTRAFSWLKENAARYHFEMSFPEGNAQGVSYEPWHWRYVGNLAAFKTFFPARLEVPSF